MAHPVAQLPAYKRSDRGGYKRWFKKYTAGSRDLFGSMFNVARHEVSVVYHADGALAGVPIHRLEHHRGGLAPSCLGNSLPTHQDQNTGNDSKQSQNSTDGCYLNGDYLQ